MKQKRIHFKDDAGVVYFMAVVVRFAKLINRFGKIENKHERNWKLNLKINNIKKTHNREVHSAKYISQLGIIRNWKYPILLKT